MKKQFFVFPALLFIAILIFSCSKDENNLAIDNETQSIETLNRSSSVNSVADIENWFEQYLTDNIGADNVTDGLSLFNIEWNNYIEWNENTYVFPMYHFVPYGRVGYTRLFVDISDVEPEAYFYSVFPDNQDQINFDIDDVINFNGDLFTFDITDGNQDILEYENGELVRFYHEDELIETRGGGVNWPDWWAPRVIDGGTVSDTWPWDNSWFGDGTADTGGGLLDCFAACPNGYPKPHPNRAGVTLNCNHERDCDGIIDIDIINIPSSGRKIHKTGSNITKGSVGGTTGNNPPNGNPKNPVDEAGLDEVRLQQFKNLVCHYKANRDLSCSCEQLESEISEDCLDAPNFFDCADAGGEYCRTIVEEDDECILAINAFEEEYGIELTVKDKKAIHKAFAENGESCSDEGFDEVAVIALIESDGGFNIDDEQGYDELNDCEKALVKQNPLCALKIRKNKDLAFSMERTKFGNIGHNDCGDAFRHAFFNALNTQSCGGPNAKAFGDAHECDTPATEQSEKEMDLSNNAVGVSIGEANKNATPDQLATLLCAELVAGNLLVLSDISDPLSALIDSDVANCSCP